MCDVRHLQLAESGPYPPRLFKVGDPDVNRRQNWRKVLALEVQRWSSVPCDQLLSELSEVKAYELEYESKTYQVEVEILENTATYVRVMVGVDDGSLPASISPETHSFICRKPK